MKLFKFRTLTNILVFLILTNSKMLAYDLDSLMKIVENTYNNIKDYTCTFSKKELIDDDYVYWNNVLYKHLKPEFYYIKFNEGTLKGAEILYAGKKYNYKLKVHLGGLLNIMNINLDPKGSIAMKNSRHSIFDSSIGYIIKLIRKNLQDAKSQNTGKIEFVKEVVLNKRKANMFKAEFPPRKGFYAYKIFISFDITLNLPVKLDVYDWNNKLMESYTFSDLKINVGQKISDFDTENDSYNF